VTESSPTRIDRLISWIAPGVAVRRRIARVQLQYLDTIAPLRPQRDSGDHRTDTSPLDTKIPWRDRLKMISLFDELVHANPLLSGMVDQFICNVVPPSGIRPIPETGSPAVDAEIAKRFEDWAETSADIRQRLNLWQFQQIYLKTILGHGDCAIVRLSDGHIQGIEADRIATPKKYTRHENKTVFQGIYTGGAPAAKGYYIAPRDKWGTLNEDKFRHIPARHVTHGFFPEDFSHWRGVSIFLPTYRYVKVLESLIRYKLFQQKMASVFGLAIKKSPNKTTSPLAAIGTSRESASAAETGATRPDIELFAGMGITINPDEEIIPIDSKTNGGDFDTFVRTVCRLIGVAVGLPLEFVLYDWTKANYYGNKMTSGMAMRRLMYCYAPVANLTSILYRWQVARWIDDGTIRLDSAVEDPFARSLTLPPPIECDEERAFKVQRMKVESNVASWDEYLKAQGRSLTRVLQRRKDEIAKQKEAGVPIIASSTPGVRLLREIED